VSGFIDLRPADGLPALQAVQVEIPALLLLTPALRLLRLPLDAATVTLHPLRPQVHRREPVEHPRPGLHEPAFAADVRLAVTEHERLHRQRAAVE
jgi:hypothetical protein